ncbi:uncharacterized protein HKW66_Vig0064590 [Vigna angularis]|uniref:Uncharacterized protein n=1 Tax=Phaseolus angularis TaxID=3914 RepID=A0A8T0KDB0_PHAAN|nr:uncharacterized protein HKW66_Vig0064590 [Vigna angularis]
MAKICDALADSTRTLDAVARAILADCYLKPRRQFTKDELGSWSTLVQRHRFLLSALVLLTLLCTVYLYFAVTLGASGTCSGLTGAQKASCHMELVKDSVAKGDMKSDYGLRLKYCDCDMYTYYLSWYL